MPSQDLLPLPLLATRTITSLQHILSWVSTESANRGKGLYTEVTARLSQYIQEGTREYVGAWILSVVE